MKKFFKPLAEAEDSSKSGDVPEKASENGAQGIEVENSPKNAIPVRQARTTRLSSIKSRRSSRRRVVKVDKWAHHRERLRRYEMKERKLVEEGIFNWQDVLLALDEYNNIEVVSK